MPEVETMGTGSGSRGIVAEDHCLLAEADSAQLDQGCVALQLVELKNQKLMPRHEFRDPLIGSRVIKSYGAMRVVFSFLTELEVTKLQVGNRFLYEKAVSRCQVRINLQPPIYFFRDGYRPQLCMFDMSTFKLSEVNCRNMQIKDHNLRIMSFKHASFVTGGRFKPRQCLRFEFFRKNSNFKRQSMKCLRASDMNAKHISHSVC